ncbi:MAG: hypothetical protein HYY34_08170 [Chloroflexi bacterium]|nr:hypothetical protein [Chloroflexota bacterium]
MSRKVRITTGDVVVTATLNDSPTADQVWEALPIRGRASTWGDEVYFSTPVSAGEADDATDTFPRGAVAFWPPGRALCLFFGRTPASTGDEPRMASPGTAVGMIDGDLRALKTVRSGAVVTVERA